MIRLIAADMDDTLLDSSSRLPERVVASLSRAMERGIRVVLASGRMLPSMTMFEKTIGVNAPMILFNGAVTCEPVTHKPIFENRVPLSLARDIARVTEEEGIYLQAYTVDRLFCKIKTEYTRLYSAASRVEAEETLRPLSEFIDFDPCKLLAIDEPDRIVELQNKLNGLWGDKMNFMQSKPRYLEMVPKGTDKGTALAALSGLLGIGRNEILAFGDGQNDISMLEYAGLGYAMEGSRAAQVIPRHAPSNDECGAAQVIDALLAEEN